MGRTQATPKIAGTWRDRATRLSCVHVLSRQGARTYHVSNYATRSDHAHIDPSYISKTDRPTSYANEKSHLISVTFDEDKGAKKIIVALVFMFLLFLGYSSSAVITLIRMIEETRLLPTGSIGNPGAQSSHLSSVYDAQLGSAGTAIFNNIPTTPGLYWDDLKGDAHCLAYGIRRYTAHLRNVPFLANRTRACKETAIQINGLDLRSPDECEIKVCYPIARVTAFATYVCPVAIWGR